MGGAYEQTNLFPVCTVTADGQEVYHDGSTSYIDWLIKMNDRLNNEYLERLDKLEREERMQRAFAENLRPKKAKRRKAPN